MKPILSFFLIILVFSSASGQDIRRQGTIQLKDGTIKNGFILYKNWNVSPTEIQFADSQSSTLTSYDKTSITGFSISDGDILEKYILQKVLIDTSRQELGEISTTKRAEAKEQEFFLKYLAQGKINLYEATREPERPQYFISPTPESQIPTELLYKKYMFEGSVWQNSGYKELLTRTLVNCPAAEKLIEGTKYTEKELIKLISTYNSCFGETQVATKDFANKAIFAVYVNSGLSGLNVTSDNSSLLYNFNSAMSYSGGLNMNVYFKRSNNKVMLTTGLGFRKESFQAEKYSSQDQTTNKIEVGQTYVEAELGMRKYYFLNTLKAFWGVSINSGFAVSSTNKRTESFMLGSNQVVRDQYYFSAAAMPGNGSAMRKHQEAVKLSIGLNKSKLGGGLYFMLGNGFSDISGTETRVSTMGLNLNYSFR
ncbi:MAG: hypothetical protein K0S09_2350 [Sphingobacteriaceae bacterium]|jgi:hypothetical protein|nr:hypothetical protein [Sphingobacteriaceae bacterium]